MNSPEVAKVEDRYDVEVLGSNILLRIVRSFPGPERSHYASYPEDLAKVLEISSLFLLRTLLHFLAPGRAGGKFIYTGILYACLKVYRYTKYIPVVHVHVLIAPEVGVRVVNYR